MNLPDKCPFCGAEPYITASGEQCRGGDRWVLFSCDTSIYAGQDLRRTQSRKCEVSERNRMLDRVAELEARCKRLEEAMELVAQMRQRWLEMEDDGYAGAYYAFVKGKDDEWNAIMQAKEAKP